MTLVATTIDLRTTGWFTTIPLDITTLVSTLGLCSVPTCRKIVGEKDHNGMCEACYTLSKLRAMVRDVPLRATGIKTTSLCPVCKKPHMYDMVFPGLHTPKYFDLTYADACAKGYSDDEHCDYIVRQIEETISAGETHVDVDCTDEAVHFVTKHQVAFDALRVFERREHARRGD